MRALATIVSPFSQDLETLDVVPDLETIPSKEDISFMDIIKEKMASNDLLNNMS